MTIEQLKVVISAQTDNINKSIKSVKKDLGTMGNEAEKQSGKMTKSFGKVGTAIKAIAAAVASIKVIQIGIEGMAELNAVTSSIQALNRMLGEESTDAFQKWAKDTAKYLGLAESEALNSAKFMGSILAGFIDPKDVVQGTSQLIGQMAIIATATGKSMSSVQEAIQSGFLGSFEQIENILPTVSRGLANQYAQVYYGADAYADLSAEQQKYIMYQMVIAESAGMYGTEINDSIAKTNAFKASLATMKIQLGASFAALVPIVIPVLQALVNGLQWVLAAVFGVANAIRAMFGKGAVDPFKNSIQNVAANAKAAKDAVGGIATGAANTAKSTKAISANLQSFDEVNTLDKDTGAADTTTGGLDLDLGGVVTDFSALGDTSALLQEKFQAFNEQMTLFSEKAGKAFDFFKKMLPYAALIAATVAGIVFFAGLGEAGSLIAFSDEIVAALAGIVGWVPAIITTVTDALVGVAMMFSGVLPTAILESVGGMIAAGAAIVGIIAAIVAAVWYLWENSASFRSDWLQVWENIKNVLVGVWENVLLPIFQGIGTALLIIWEKGLQPLWEAWTSMWEQILGIVADVWNELSPIFAELLEFLGPVLTVVCEALGVVVGTLGAIILRVFAVIFAVIETLAVFVRKMVSTVVDLFKALWTNIGDIFGGVKDIFNGFIDFITGIFTGNWALAWDGVVGIFKGIFEGLVNIAKVPLNLIIGLVNTVINGINAVTGGLNKIPGVDIGEIGQIPYLAKGGIVDGATVAMIGEAGREAVVPLDRNTEWANTIADVVLNKVGNTGTGGGDMQVVFELNGKKFAQATLSDFENEARRQGGLKVKLA